MWLGFFKECMVSLIFLGINLFSLPVTFFWSQLKVHIYSLNMRDIIIYVARWWEKYLSKRSLLKNTCSWHDKLIVLWILNRQAKIFLRKDHDFDMISIRMLKICGDSIFKPLELTFKSCIANGKKLMLSQFIKKITNS